MDSSPSVTIEIIPVNIELNFEEIHRKNVCHCYRYLVDLGAFFISVMSCCVFLALPVIEIVIGIMYRNQCSINDFIPIYLLVAGIISIILLVLTIIGVKLSNEHFLSRSSIFFSGFFSGQESIVSNWKQSNHSSSMLRLSINSHLFWPYLSFYSVVAGLFS